jgi:hypothetical protein
MFNNSGYEESNLTPKQVGSIDGFDNLSDDEINAVLKFLLEIAKLEIKMQEINNFK